MSVHSDEEARRRIEETGRQTRRRLTDLTHDFDAVVAASRDTNADDEHDPEGTTIAFERSQVAALVRQAHVRLEEVEAALAKLDAGTYGVCESCEQPIGEARLEAMPVARECIRCAASCQH